MTDCSLTDLTRPEPVNVLFKIGQNTHSLGSGESTVGGCNEVHDDHENCEAMPGPVRDRYQHLDGWIVSTLPNCCWTPAGWGNLEECQRQR